LDVFVQQEIQRQGGKVAMGGYGEHRAIYQRSEHFNALDEATNRCIHLGVDLWTSAGTPVYVPLEGKIHSFRYNDQFLDYGATIILEHCLEDTIFYSLYGHLSLISLEGLYEGKPVEGGELLATLGDRTENGGWSPHLHLQLIRDLGDWKGDYPGVATRLEAAGYLENCPNTQPLYFKIPTQPSPKERAFT
jgi:murein DD-endopeptidase MepM/ murein hydrolase activator NlpD